MTLERLYEEHGALVFNYVRSILRDRDEGEDCVIDTFVAALRSLRTGQVREPSRAWLLTIARHKALRRLKGNRWHLRFEEQHELCVEAKFELEMVVEDELKQIFEGLTKDEQQAIWMHDGLGLTHQEIAGILETPLGTILARIFRARKKIQSRLGEGDPDG